MSICTPPYKTTDPSIFNRDQCETLKEIVNFQQAPRCGRRCHNASKSILFGPYPDRYTYQGRVEKLPFVGDELTHPTRFFAGKILISWISNPQRNWVDEYLSIEIIGSANFFTIRAQSLRSTYPNQLALQCETQFSFDRTGKFHTRDSGIESVIF